MRPRRVLVLASKPKGISPSQRYRFEQWLPHLARDHGIELHLAPFESHALTELLYQPGRIGQKIALTLKDFFRRLPLVARARSYDAILIHREASLIGPAIYERLASWTGVPLIYDFDDAVWSSAQLNMNGLFSKLHFFGKTSTLCRIADAVTVANGFLAAYARERNTSVTVIPSTVDLDLYPVMPESNDSKFVICWTGSTSTLAHFEHGREALEALAKRIPIVVKIVCSMPPAVPIAGAEMRFVQWTPEREARDVGDCHVGIMPLPDNEATRGKSAMKALQYMATGRPAVVSPVGVNADIVRSSHNGFLAGTTDEWVSALERLAKDPGLRARLGRNARQTVEERFTAQIAAAQFAEVVDRLLP